MKKRMSTLSLAAAVAALFGVAVGALLVLAFAKDFVAGLV